MSAPGAGSRHWNVRAAKDRQAVLPVRAKSSFWPAARTQGVRYERTTFRERVFDRDELIYHNI